MLDKESKRVYLVEIYVSYFDAHFDACFENRFDKYYSLSMEFNKLDYMTSVIVLILGSVGHLHSRCVSGVILLCVCRDEASVVRNCISNRSIIVSC